jgi:hypothetical protein
MKIRKLLFITGIDLVILSFVCGVISVAGNGVLFSKNIVNPLYELLHINIPTISLIFGIVLSVTMVLGGILIVVSINMKEVATVKEVI